MKRVVVALALAALPSLTLAMPQTKEPAAPAAGLWHLVPKDTDEQNIPEHRVDIRLYPTPAPFRAAMVNRVTGQDMPGSVASTTFDGRKLRLEMKGDVAHVFLDLNWDGTRFEGMYLDPAGKPVAGAIPLKLVRSRMTLETPQTKELPPPAAGLWHLLLQGQSEQELPEHRTDLRLFPTPAPFRAAIVNHSTGDDIPYPVAVFDGKTLTLQMGTHGGPPNAGMPFLRMTWNGTRFEGTYVDAAFQPLKDAVAMKLIKSSK